MCIKSSLETLGFCLLISLALPLFFSTSSSKERAEENSASTTFFAPCPNGSRRTGQNCTVDTTLVLSSNRTLNCRGNTLIPVTTGTASTRSTPEVAVFLKNVQNARITNCMIQGFDFGVFAISSKSPFTSVQIQNNTITSRFTAISLMSVDKAQISQNNLRFTAQRGRALYIGRDSDRNEITYNTITSNLTADNLDVVRAPGPGGLSNRPIGNQPSAVVIGQVEPPEHALINIVIETKENNVLVKRVHQNQVFDSPTQSGFSEGNIFAHNTIRFSGEPTDGIFLSLPHGTIVTRNEILRAKNSIRLAVQYGMKTFPGKCKPDRGRYCLEDADCNITGVDDPRVRATCVNSSTRTISWTGRGNRIEANEVIDPSDGGILVAAEGTQILSNSISRSSSSGKPTDVGILLTGSLALKNATVVNRNTVSQFSRGLQLIKVPDFVGGQRLIASAFAAQISLNDFTAYRTAVVTDTGYDLLSELSVSGQGNYWGKCPGLKKTDVEDEDGKNLPGFFVKDTFSFASPVARRRQLGPRCP